MLIKVSAWAGLGWVNGLKGVLIVGLEMVTCILHDIAACVALACTTEDDCTAEEGRWHSEVQACVPAGHCPSTVCADS